MSPERQRKLRTVCATLLVLMTMPLLASCKMGRSDVAVKIVCPAIKSYPKATLDRALVEYKALAPGSAIKEMFGDYSQLRDQIRACNK
jgi:hypothetical protein